MNDKSDQILTKVPPEVNPHAPTHTPEFDSWYQMHRRCYIPKAPKYPIYGGRGITVCERWHSFPSFCADMGVKPSTEHQLDRINNNGNYEPGNCRWATRKEQARNRRTNTVVTVNGITGPVIELCEQLKVPYGMVRQRLTTLGWTPEKAFLTPRRGAGRPRGARVNPAMRPA